MANIEVAFTLTGIILILGFIGHYLFKRVSIPDILILIFLGFLIGPVLKIIDPGSLTSILPIFTSLALLIILFDGGLNLNLRKVLSESPRAIVLATTGFILSILATTAFAFFVFKWDLITGVLLGAIIGGTSSAIVIPLVSRAMVSDKVKTLLSLESAFTDALVVVAALAILPLLSQAPTYDLYLLTAKSVASAFSIGIVTGIIAGVVWLKILHHLEDDTYDDIITLAFVLLGFALTQSIGGNGAIFALVFGLVLGNGHVVTEMFKMKKTLVVGDFMKRFQTQISFLIRTFFFVYIGLIFSAINIWTFIYTTILCVVLVAVRFVAAYIATAKSDVLQESRDLIIAMVPRGLAAAVLAQIVTSEGIPMAPLLSDIVVTVIIITTIFSAVGTSIFQHVVVSEQTKQNAKK